MSAPLAKKLGSGAAPHPLADFYNALSGIDALPYDRANAGDRAAQQQIALFYEQTVLPRLRAVADSAETPTIPQPGSQFGLRSPFPAAHRASALSGLAAQAAIADLMPFIYGQRNYENTGKGVRPLWGGLPMSLRNEGALALGKPLS